MVVIDSTLTTYGWYLWFTTSHTARGCRPGSVAEDTRSFRWTPSETACSKRALVSWHALLEMEYWSYRRQ